MSAHDGAVTIVTAIREQLRADKQFTAGLMDHALEALERARVVGVLDAHPTERGWEVYPHGKVWRCGLGSAKQIEGSTPDDARAAAARAIEAGEV